MKTYFAVAEFYSSVTKGQPVISESFSVHGALPTTGARMDSYRRPVDPRLSRAAPGDAAAGGRGKKRDRHFGAGAYNGGGVAAGYADYSEDDVGNYVQTAAAAGYAQYGGAAQAQAQQQWGGYASYYNTGVPWQAAARESEEVAYTGASSEKHSDRERIVEFSQSAPVAPVHSGYGHYYDDGSWAGYNGSGVVQYTPPMAQGYAGYGPASQYGPPPSTVHGDINGSSSRHGHRSPAPGDRTAVYGRLKVNLRTREP